MVRGKQSRRNLFMSGFHLKLQLYFARHKRYFITFRSGAARLLHKLLSLEERAAAGCQKMVRRLFIDPSLWVVASAQHVTRLFSLLLHAVRVLCLGCVGGAKSGGASDQPCSSGNEWEEKPRQQRLRRADSGGSGDLTSVAMIDAVPCWFFGSRKECERVRDARKKTEEALLSRILFQAYCPGKGS
ncbi:unnamed protein product [Phaeothamnion confervicola]